MPIWKCPICLKDKPQVEFRRSKSGVYQNDGCLNCKPAKWKPKIPNTPFSEKAFINHRAPAVQEPRDRGQDIFRMAKDAALDSIQTASEAERQFVSHAKFKGWRVIKTGWPDFMIFRKDKTGELQFQAVEVKLNHLDDNLRPGQKLMLSILTVLNIPCFVWSADQHSLRLMRKDTAKRNIEQLVGHLDGCDVRAGLKTLESLGCKVRWY